MLYAYPCELTVDEDGAYVATFPDVPEITGGKNRAEALTMAADAIDTALEGYIHQGWAIPTPSKVRGGQELVRVPMVMPSTRREAFGIRNGFPRKPEWRVGNAPTSGVKLKRKSGRPDLNRGLPAPKAGALPGCATPRRWHTYYCIRFRGLMYL